jgi:catechol 2,3-dioxygenase
VELYWDKPKEQWPKDDNGHLQMRTEPLDLNDLLKLASPIPTSPEGEGHQLT